MITFQIVQSDAVKPWHTRIRASNGLTWFTSQQYTDRDSAVKAAVHLVVELVQPVDYSVDKQGDDQYLVYTRTDGQNRAVLIERVDERAGVEPPC